jgi:4,5-DOPA dioxygenase extradiol
MRLRFGHGSEAHTRDHAPSPPSLFVPHGAPTFALRPVRPGRRWRRRPPACPGRGRSSSSARTGTPRRRPSAAAAASTRSTISAAFPPALYALRLPGHRQPGTAAEVLAALRSGRAAGRGRCRARPRPRRLGAAAPDVPRRRRAGDTAVDPEPRRPRTAWRLGRALARAARARLPVIGSGNLTHNLRDYGWRIAQRRPPRPPTCAASPTGWPNGCRGDIDALLDYRRLAPAARGRIRAKNTCCRCSSRSAPAGDTAQATRFHAGIDEHVLAMDAWAFGPSAGGDRA